MKKQARAAVAAVAVSAGIAAGVFLWKREASFRAWNGQYIPPSGLVMNPNVSKTGDPENAAKDLRKIYAAIVAYRDQNGKLPFPPVLLDYSKPVAPGHALTRADFETPDRPLSDGYLKGDQTPEYMFAYMTERPDGKPKPATPAPGEKDVWLVSTTYAHNGQVIHRDGRSEMRPSGVYVILWSDGSIEQVPSFKELKYPDPKQRGAWVTGFAGQTGMPSAAVTVEAYYKRIAAVTMAK